jgi:hypothetical protein
MDSSRELLARSDVLTVPVAVMRFNLEAGGCSHGLPG